MNGLNISKSGLSTTGEWDVQNFTSSIIIAQFLVAPKLLPTPQIYAYDTCIKQFGPRHNFMGFIDSDEFIVVNSGKSIPSVLEEYASYGGVTLSWFYFGSSGHKSRPKPLGVIAHYNKCIPDFHIKTIINTRHTLGPSGEPHSFRYSPGQYAVDTAFRRVRGPFNPSRNATPSSVRSLNLFDVMHINHYVIRSLEDYEDKMRRGTVDGGVRNMKYFHRIDGTTTEDCPVLKMPPFVSDEEISKRHPYRATSQKSYDNVEQAANGLQLARTAAVVALLIIILFRRLADKELFI